jgi:L-aminopeptidase/D-esterase-like protein
MPALTDVPGLKVGHWTDLDAATGCTVVLCEPAAVAGVDVRGAAPGTRETDLLRPGSLVGRVDAIVLTGGSAFGLAAATGVVRYLEERDIGFQTSAGPVPIVPAAVLFDLGIGRSDVRPDDAAGYAACVAASDSVMEGCVGAGTGATVAKRGGRETSIKSGLGTASVTLPDGTVVSALVAVNAVGSVVDPATGTVLAAPRATVTDALAPIGTGSNTTLGVVATTARLDSAQVNRMASVAHDGLALAIRPAHTPFDGDTIFALSLAGAGAGPPDELQIGAAVVAVVVAAVLRAVTTATSLHGVPAIGTH